ncbi:phage tail tube protein [Pseudazoarcus pumilus]|uniref:phage tail tube protein n=1 Tax=Pseudazoarcus pumilus TaxID=2067960 RepID=UPI0013DD7913|nr:phage tail tube protein [Pseudazoarcus pumilus]
MPLDLFRLRALLLKPEATEGTDSAPTPAANALQIMNGQGQIESERLSREIDTPYFSSRPFVRTRQRGSVSGSIELLGAAQVGDPAPIDALLRAGAHAYTQVLDVDEVTPLAAEYNPVSTGIISATAWFYHGGELVKLTGCRAALNRIMLAINDFAKAEFQLQGSVAGVTESALPGDTDYSAYQEPVAITTESFEVQIDDTKVDGVSIELDTGAQLTMVEHSEARVTRLTDRQVSGTLRIYRPEVSYLDIRALVAAHARVPVFATVTGPAGRSVRLDLPSVQMGDPQRTDIDGIAAWDIPIVAMADAGNDEYLFTFN